MKLSEKARENMTKGQLLTCHVRSEPVLAALDRTPREAFIPEIYRGSAYVDEAIPLTPDRFLMEPLVFARLLELADVRIYDKVLDIGCGFGYSAAVLGQLADKVVAVESEPELVEKARQLLGSVGNVEIVTAALPMGYKVKQPYETILIEGAVEHVPQALLEQLTEGGCLVTFECYQRRPGSHSGNCKALKVVRHDGGYEYIRDFDAAVALLPGFEKPKNFQFN